MQLLDAPTTPICSPLDIFLGTCSSGEIYIDFLSRDSKNLTMFSPPFTSEELTMGDGATKMQKN
jgi:hypothetical protein